MTSALYQAAIVALARSASGAGRLQPADGSARIDNPLCGDEVTLDLRLAGDRVEVIGHRVRGCLLCEAAAAWLSDYLPGRAVAELPLLVEQVTQLLRHGKVPAAAPSGLDVFTPVHAARSRHRCVQLPFEALLAAVADARGEDPASAASDGESAPP